ELLLACEADARGRTGREDEPYPQAAYLKTALAAAAAATLSEQERRGLSGTAIGEQLRGRRFAAVSAVKSAQDALPKYSGIGGARSVHQGGAPRAPRAQRSAQHPLPHQGE